MKKKPYANEIVTFNRRYNELSKSVISLIRKYMQSGKTESEAVTLALKETQFRSKIKSSILEMVEITVSPIFKADKLSEVKGLWLYAKWPGQDKNLLKTINTAPFKSRITEEIRLGIKNGNNWQRLALDIKKIGNAGEVAKLPKHINQLVAASRKSLQGDPASIKAYKKAVDRSLKEVSKLAQGTAPTEFLKKAYENIIKATQKGSETAIQNAIVRGVDNKAKYNAQRIARTEISRAHAQKKMAIARKNDNIKAMKWILNSSHVIDDICDYHAGADLYGYGAGVHPVDNFPMQPAHPNCGCDSAYVYIVNGSGKYRGGAPEKYFDKIPEKKAKKMLGVAGYERYKTDKSTWNKNLAGFNKKPFLSILPKELLDI